MRRAFIRERIAVLATASVLSPAPCWEAFSKVLRHALPLLIGALAQSAFAVSSLTRTSSFEYDSGTGLLTKEIIEPGSSDRCLVTTYSYDAFGNRNGATTRNCNGSAGEAAAPSGDAVFASRTSATSYAATGANPVAGQFPTSSTNALTQSEAKELDAKFGGITKLTGPNSLATLWEYDSFGRKKKETRADGTVTEWFYELCTALGGACPTLGQYRVRVTATGSPTSSTYYDSLNREIRAETQGFDGTLVRKDTEYDALGRVKQVSKPYLVGGTVYWTVLAYDILGRVTQADEPAGGSGAARTVTAYSGLVTTVTVSNAGGTTNMPGAATQVRTTTKNSQGQTVEVKDTQNNTVAYTYDPFGNLLTTNAGGVVTTLSYDLRGRKTQMVDPDMGTWTYDYNALGELIRQTDAKSQVTTMAYDLLGRMTSRTEPDLSSTWTFDSCTKGVGKLCVAATSAYTRTHSYDSLGRPSTVSMTLDSVSYTATTTYDGSGRLDTVAYPTGFTVKNLYNAYGHLWKVRRDDSGDTTVFWEGTTQNAAGQFTGEALGNGLLVSRAYDALFRLTAVSATDGTTTPHSQTFAYDPIGNVTQRVDVVQTVTENFVFDTLNRLTGVSGTVPARTFTYSAIGNVASKSDVGTYTYPAVNAARPHAVSSVTNGGAANSITASYTYDANGNLTAASGTIYPATGSAAFTRALAYTSFNMPATVGYTLGSTACTIGGTNYSFCYAYSYNAEHERVKLVTERPSDTLTSVYFHPAGKGTLLYEKETRTSDGLVEHKHYVNGGAGLVGMFVTKSAYGGGDGPQMRYYHKDHLGSIAVLTNPSAAVLESFGYEAFGERRYPAGGEQDRASPIIGTLTDRGFTAHEHLDEMNLIHMNGRIYDPALGRFMTPDPFLQSPDNLQSYNRYSYALNNPLMYTDPSGYFNLLKSVEKLWKAVWRSEVGRIAVSVAAAYFLGVHDGGIFSGNAIANGIAGGFAGGFVGGGGSLEGGLRGAFTGALFGQIGSYGLKEGWGTAEYVAAHAAAGCLAGAASGGECGSGALAAGFAKYATLEWTKGLDRFAQGVVVTVVGGTASALGGGRFENGALTAAFGYLFNELGSCYQRGYCSRPRLESSFDPETGCVGGGDASICVGPGAIRTIGGRMASAIFSAQGELRLSNTASESLANRPEVSALAVREAVAFGERVPDPQGVAGRFMYYIDAVYKGTQGRLEVLVNETRGIVEHGLFRRK